jgi:hypothetical protein
VISEGNENEEESESDVCLGASDIVFTSVRQFPLPVCPKQEAKKATKDQEKLNLTNGVIRNEAITESLAAGNNL